MAALAPLPLVPQLLHPSKVSRYTIPVGHTLLVQVMSSLAMVVNAFEGHAVHESASKKVTNGFDMKEPIGQHPKRAVLDPRLLNALLLPVKDSHVPPQSVRVKPLLENTWMEKNRTSETCDPTNLELSYVYSTTHHNGRRRGQQRGRESTLTVSHICHRSRIPVGHV